MRTHALRLCSLASSIRRFPVAPLALPVPYLSAHLIQCEGGLLSLYLRDRVFLKAHYTQDVHATDPKKG